MMKNNLFPVAKEGWKYIAYAFVAFVVFAIFDLELLSVLSFILAAFFVFVYRNPERELPRFEQNSVVCPVDGTILSIDEIDGKEYAYKLIIDSNYLDVPVLRAPVSGSVYSLDQSNGTRLGSDTALCAKLNENVNIVFEDNNSNRLKISHILKQSLDGIKIDSIKSQNMLQTSRYGVMINGITTIYLPQNFRLNISVGNEVKASETLVGYFS